MFFMFIVLFVGGSECGDCSFLIRGMRLVFSSFSSGTTMQELTK